MVRIVSPNSQPMFSSSSSSALSWSTPTTTPTTTSTWMTETVNGSHLFNIAGYSLLNLKGIGIGNYVASDTFTAGDYSWAIYFYPDGKKVQYDAPYASLFIVLASEGTDVRAFFELKLLDQSGKGRHKVHTQFDSGPYTIRNRGSMWGCERFFKRTDLETSDYLKDDCLKVHCSGIVLIMKVHRLKGLCLNPLVMLKTLVVLSWINQDVCNMKGRNKLRMFHGPARWTKRSLRGPSWQSLFFKLWRNGLKGLELVPHSRIMKEVLRVVV
ncbi:hypothetical protein RGQ29_031646 [Quercus rubra]|uniref:MATH domain-containing protein n=1 Tax=Quercus rubra TaxID=3512 RepID=A0AAN7IJP9_QUERU|nr:hypothetical protein RGQ29_031646 [Quercus rubra]